ncbi:MAG: NAD-binding protein [Acidobacteria bacterium]|nr:NAD-binding protein [Acidobacteriota bacterium]
MDKSTRPTNAQSRGNSKRKQSVGTPATADLLWPASWQWPAIGILTAVALVLGYIGFWKNAASRLEVRRPLDILYVTFQLFIMESGNVPGPVSWELEIARLLAPVVPAWTVVIAAAILFRDQIQRFRMRWLRDHVVICGLSRSDLELARDARSNGRRVVVIEIDDENDYVQSVENIGCSVIIGDSTDAAVLAGARADRADAFIAVAGEDGINIAAAVALQDLVLRMPEQSRGGSACFVHVTDPELCLMLQESRLTEDASRRLNLSYFNFYQDSARL